MTKQISKAVYICVNCNKAKRQFIKSSRMLFNSILVPMDYFDITNVLQLVDDRLLFLSFVIKTPSKVVRNQLKA